MTTTRRQTVQPYLYYRDGVAAIEFLCRAFGFVERQRDLRDDGSLFHGEVTHEGDLIMLGTPEASPSSGPPATDHVYDSSVYCSVADAEQHCARARAAGAEIVTEPVNEPWGRVYCAADPEGRQWHFYQVRMP